METVGAAIYASLFPMDTVADAPMAQRYVKMVTPAKKVCLFSTMDIYSWFTLDVIVFENVNLKSHQSCYPYQEEEGLNLYLITTFQLISLLRLDTR